MRDIRPNPRHQRAPEMEPDDFDDEEAAIPAPKPRFAGSHVPVSKVHVNRHAVPAKSQRVHKQLAQAEEVPPIAKEALAAQTARPLFAAPAKKPKKAGGFGHMRIGQKERLVVAGFFGLILIAAVLAGLIFLPSATIDLTLRAAPLLVDEKFVLSTQGAPSDKTLPGTGFAREVEVKGASPVTSREVIGAKASGVLQLVNRTTDEQKIKERSRLETKDGVLFYMAQHAIIPPAEGGVPSRVSVPVEAALAGPEGNIAPQRLNFVALDSSAQSLVYAENTATLTGGSGEEISVVKQADIDAAKVAAGQAGRVQAEAEIRRELPRGWTVLEESWASEIKAFDTPTALEAKQAEIPYTARVIVHAFGYENEKFQAALMAALNTKLDQDFMLFPGPISFTSAVESADWEKGEGTIAVRITHMTVPNFSVDTLKDKLAGRSQEEALKYLQGLKGVQKATVTTWPFWVSSIPTIDKRISIQLHSQQ
ncbi:MAG: hypothetical protein HYZ62_00235 [Candidatus Andersenbacteria bacterium]|nr:hypothetical protein [Candidatus Andersenbacteria bacterium]